MIKKDQKKAKIAFLFFIIFFGFLIFLGTLFYWVTARRELPSIRKTTTNSALRGDIISTNNYTIAKSKKLYKAMVDTRNIDPDKKELFLKLYSIYSGADITKVQKSIDSHFGTVTLSYKINSQDAQRLKELANKLYRFGVFISYQSKNGTTFKHGLDIVESGEYRVYNYKDILTPIIGYVRKYEKKHITKIYGANGLEKQYEHTLTPIKDAHTSGFKDSNGYMIMTRDYMQDNRVDGLNIHLNISLKLQKIVENILDNYKTKFRAKEIVACVMQSKTGKILTLASSNRYNPSSIKKSQYRNLNISAIRFTYEPGSVLKPIIFALLLKKKKINPYDMVNLHNGRYKIGRNTITDDHKYKWLSAQNVIVHSSNIGMSQLAQKLNYLDYHSGLKEFGFSKKSGIDLPYEHKGTIPNMHRLKSKIYKAVTSYGYGIEVNFIQLLKAYNLFNNSGKEITPRIVNYYQDSNFQKYQIQPNPIKEIIPPNVAKQMQNILIKTVEEGTAKATIIKGLSVGGKTGTAKIASKGGYTNLYNSSFFGFANDEKSNYTIGVLVREPNKKHYYASKSAVPVFKKVVKALVQESFLKIKLSP